MHQESGLWDDLRRENIRGAVSEFAAERTICAALDRLEPGLVSMAGSGVSQFDMRWTAKWMPALHRRLTYYSIDMGTFERTLSVLTSGQMPSKRQGIAHRAVPDIMFSHSLAKSYRATLR
jgi:oligoribonuclease (3'-5' exoribonuclease)